MDKNKVMLIAIIALLVILIGIIIAAVIMLPGMIRDKDKPAETEIETTVEHSNISLITIEDPIKTNLKTGLDDEPHVIQAKFSVGVDMSDKEKSQKLYDMLTEKTVVIQDVILNSVRNKTFEDLQKADAQEILREEILTRLQEEFSSNLIIRVYISDLIMQ